MEKKSSLHQNTTNTCEHVKRETPEKNGWKRVGNVDKLIK